MSAKYLLRFDDVCPTLNWSVWEQVEEMLLRFSVKPILAVVPANQDPNLKRGEANPNFWERVRTWQHRGWAIGLHGYQHLYVTNDGGVMGINPRSEFSGLTNLEQQSKLQQALKVFEHEGVSPDLWIAPGHSFDATTLDVLRGLGILHVSDGFSLYPYLDAQGMMWVPQQLWRFRKMPFGLWTICLHLNRWTPADMAQFQSDLQEFSGAITDWQSVISAYSNRKRKISDSLFGRAYWIALKGRGLLRNSSRLNSR